MKRTMAIALGLTLAFLWGCNRNSSAPAFDPQKEIQVVSREDGSGTRGAFIELFGIEQKGQDGTRKDLTTREAIIAKQTDVMMITVAGDKYAAGYISLGSLNDTVAALDINGITASTENVKNGSYPISRPFNIAVKDELTDLARDFIEFILSAGGQETAAKSYIPVNAQAAPYGGNRPGGKIVVAGSSSVTPLMEKLKEAYIVLNPGAEIEIQMSDSSAGIAAVLDGTCDIGMASRELKESEQKELTAIQIAIDGLAVIVNRENPFKSLTKEQVRDIFTGAVTTWSEVK
jgi:phosphate transport system substrate-binding protein